MIKYKIKLDSIELLIERVLDLYDIDLVTHEDDITNIYVFKECREDYWKLIISHQSGSVAIFDV